jgi:hypothetical protein
MRILMGVIPDRHGTYYARKKVPKGLEEAVPRVLENGKHRQAWLKRSLGTKSAHEANIRAKPVLIEFDRTIDRARDLLKQQPTRKALSTTEIARVAEYHYATVLGNDAAVRREARQIMAEFHGDASGSSSSGLTDDEFDRIGQSYMIELKEAQAALARGNIEWIAPLVDELLEMFGIRLDPAAASYRSLGTAVLMAHVKALQAIQRRHAGEPVETPRQPEITEPGTPQGDTLRAAFQGWQKARNPSPGTLTEYERAIRLFTELHGDMAVVSIKRSHARRFREALQDVPRHRQGDLLKASLSELAEWGRKHPDAPRLSEAQSISCWEAFKPSPYGRATKASSRTMSSGLIRSRRCALKRTSQTANRSAPLSLHSCSPLRCSQRVNGPRAGKGKRPTGCHSLDCSQAHGAESLRGSQRPMSAQRKPPDTL